MKRKLLPFLLIACSLIPLHSKAQTCTGVVLNISATNASTSGMAYSWTVPAGGPYKIRITAKGAKGGNSDDYNNVGGAGANMVGEFIVSSGQVLTAVAGAPGSGGRFTGGGGGGSGVQIQASAAPLIVAGGGGGSGDTPPSFGGGGGGGQVTNNGSGGGAAGGSGGGGGGGFSSAGGNSSNIYSGGGGGGGLNGIGGFSKDNVGFGGGGFGAGGGGGHVCSSPGCTEITSNFSGGGGGGYSGGNGGGGWNGGSGGGSINFGTNQNNTAGANNGGGVVTIECLGVATLSATVTATPSACNTPTQGSVSIDLTGDLNGNTNGVEYAIVSGNSFTGTPTFTDITAEPFSLTSGTGTTVGTYTVRMRLKYNPDVFVDRTYTLLPSTTGTIYVKANASGANNGTSWTDAFTSLQDALAVACSGAQIWVAKGTYYPSTNDRNASFAMKAGVKMYGGFAGSETNLTDRNWTTNPTILSGDIDKNDGANFANNSGNSYHVIFNNNNGLTTTNSLLDGFTITGGNGDYGGGMHNRGFSSPSINNVTFSGNSATQYGGGMYNFQNSSPSLNNVTFSSNKANLGGGMYNLNTCSPSLNHVTFLGNTAASQGGGMFNDTESSPSLRNCIFWGNGDEVVNFFRSSPTYTYSLVKGLNPSGTGNLDGTNAANDPLFVNAANPAGADGIFMTADDGLALQPCSPVINKGDNTNAPATDIANRTRLAGGTVDMGAYEYQGNPATGTRLYVSATAPANGDGTTWASAYQDLQVALATARTCSNITEIWVAKGTYYPTTNPSDRDASFVMKAGVKIYGGFAGSETNLTDRNWATNPTILSGDIDHTTDPLAVTGSGSTLSITGNDGNSYHVILNNGNGLTTTNSLLDGFTISGGSSGGNGGGMYNYSSSPSLTNCIFSGNQASGGGGGMYNYSSSPSLVNCSFSGNQTNNFGGGMCNIQSSPNLVNCSFSGNQTDKQSGVMFNTGSSPSLTNCSLSGNQCGIGVYNYTDTFVSLKNCILWDNGTEVVNSRVSSNTTYTNTLVKGSAVGGFQGTEDPLFVNAAGGDLRLQACSPVLNAGNNNDNSSTTDLDGNKRRFGVIDLGAYEYQANPVSKPTATAGTTKPTVCLGANLALTASGGNIFSWNGPIGSNFSSTAQNPSPVASSTAFTGVYSVTVANANCPLTATATVSVQINPSITVSVSFAPVCLVGNPLNLSASGGSDYRWRGPNSFTSTSATPGKAKTVAKDEGVYSVTVTGNGVCTATSTIRVFYGIGAGEISISNRSPYCKGGPISLTATAAGASSYRWTKQFGMATFTGNPVTITNNAKTSDGGVYTVFVTGQNGCIEKQETLVTVSQVACMGTRLANEEGEEIDMQINAYPNPVSNTLTVEVTLQKPSKLSLKLFNSIGKESGSWQLNEEAIYHKTELNLSDLQGGLYLLQAQAGKQRAVKRVVKIQD